MSGDGKGMVSLEGKKGVINAPCSAGETLTVTASVLGLLRWKWQNRTPVWANK